MTMITRGVWGPVRLDGDSGPPAGVRRSKLDILPRGLLLLVTQVSTAVHWGHEGLWSLIGSWLSGHCCDDGQVSSGQLRPCLET